MTGSGEHRRRAGRWPSGHLSWVFEGIAHFEGGATTFLAAGAARGERMILVSDSPRQDLWPRDLIDSGRLVVASTSEMYGPDLMVDADAQNGLFAAELDRARADGYSGIRVAADNTSLIAGPERLSCWVRWEKRADQFMAENPVTGMCAFDRSRVAVGTLSALGQLHPVVLGL